MKTSWALDYTCATHEAGLWWWVWAPGPKFHLLEAVRSYQPCVRAFFFPPWKLMKIHVVVLMPAGSCRILRVVSTLPSSFIHCPQICGHRQALVNLYWRLMCLPKWVCQEKWNKLIFLPMLPCNQDIPMHILRRLHFGGIFYISINLCMCY